MIKLKRRILDEKKSNHSLDWQKVDLIKNFFAGCSPLLFALALYSGIRHYLGEARYIPSGSMLPGLKINDRLIIEKLTFRKRSPKHGEIVVFKSPYSFDKELIANRAGNLPSSLKCSLVTFPLFSWFPIISDPACDAYIKRVIAVGGDEIIVNSKGAVVLNNKLLDEPYVRNFCSEKVSFDSCKPIRASVPAGYVFVLGDNRPNSLDSRFWPGGPFLSESDIIGKASWRFWPLKRIGNLK